MLKDITLGQYVPGETVVHRLDPRTKILVMLAYIVITFCVQNFAGYAVLAAFVVGTVAISKIPPVMVVKGLKPIMVFIVITGLFNLFLTSGGEVIWQYGVLKITDEGVRFAVFMVLRLTFLILGTSLLTLTTSPISLTDGMESLLRPFKKIGVPAHELSMMMSIALRFIPILLEETDKIMKAQIARGADLENGNLIQRVKAMVPIFVPLFVSSFRRANDLAMAMEARCYRGGEGKTKMKPLVYGTVDFTAYAVILLYLVAIVLIGKFVTFKLWIF